MPEITVQTADGTPHRFPLAEGARDDRPLARQRHLPLRPVALAPPRRDPRAAPTASTSSTSGARTAPCSTARRCPTSSGSGAGDVITLGRAHPDLLRRRRRPVDLEEEAEPAGTRIFSARELSDIKTKPVDAADLVRQNRLLATLQRGRQEPARPPPAPGALRRRPEAGLRGRSRRARRDHAARGLPAASPSSRPHAPGAGSRSST